VKEVCFPNRMDIHVCLAQCRHELEEEGDMTEDEILRETANIR